MERFPKLLHAKESTLSKISSNIEIYISEEDEKAPEDIISFIIYLFVEKGMFYNKIADILGLTYGTLTAPLRKMELSEELAYLKGLLFDQNAFDEQYQGFVEIALSPLNFRHAQLSQPLHYQMEKYSGFANMTFAEIILHLHWIENISIQDLIKSLSIGYDTFAKVMKGLNIRLRSTQEALEASWRPGGKHYNSLRGKRSESWGQGGGESKSSTPTGSLAEERSLLAPVIVNEYTEAQKLALQQAIRILEDADLPEHVKALEEV